MILPAVKGNQTIFFDERPIENKQKSLREGRKIYDSVIHITIRNPGSRDTFVIPWNDLDSNSKERYTPQYERFLTKKEQTIEGTPLETAPFLSAQQVLELKAVSVYTIEQLANLSMTGQQKLQFAAVFVSKAKNYLEAAKGTVDVVSLKETLQQLAETNANYETEIAELRAQLKSLLDKQPKKSTKAAAEVDD